MKPNQRGRYNGRYNNGSGRGTRPQMILRNTSLESTGPCGKLHGTALQLFEKYQAAAKDAMIQNDDVLAETCLQYADHYMHMQNLAIANEQSLRPQPRPSMPAPEAIPEEATNKIASETPVAPVEDKMPQQKSFPTDGELKVLDLSVPVADMAAKEVIEKPTQQPRRKKLSPPKTPEESK